MIEESEQHSPNYVSEEQRKKRLESANWEEWADAQLRMEEQNRKDMFNPVEKDAVVPVSGSNPFGGLTWILTSDHKTNTQWLNPTPPPLKAPRQKNSKIRP